VRVTIKDNFKVQAIQTTQSNRAYVGLYGPEQDSAQYVRKMVDLGAVIVGKMKLSAFSSSEEATDQLIDFHTPFNPRADGYQSPSGSTTGGATAVAGYDWVDVSTGTDSRLLMNGLIYFPHMTDYRGDWQHSVARGMEWPLRVEDFTRRGKSGWRLLLLPASFSPQLGSTS
jgi:hypothetical protein